MLIPAVIDAMSSGKEWINFIIASSITCFIGISLFLVTHGKSSKLDIRQIFILTTASWLTTAFFGSLPFYFCSYQISFVDAFFESMSGITTTGSTVLTDLDNISKGILIWRALLQWLGGIGFVILAIAALPKLKVSGNQLFQSEFSDKLTKTRPSLASLASWIGAIYIFITALCTFFYWAAGMSSFDSIAHAMTTIATGGFSTSDFSLGFFSDPKIEIVATVFMILGSLPFIVFVMVMKGKLKRLLKDSQIRWFLYVLIFSTIIVTFWQITINDQNLITALRQSAFNVTSILTGTGYSTTDYWAWGSFPVIIFLILMFVGGCSGSTSCSIKIFRYQILYAAMRSQIESLIRPHRVFVPHYNGEPISENITDTVFAFFFLFLLLFALLTLALSILGLDFVTSISSAATALTNVGPGLGEVVGPAGNFSSLPSTAKWLLSFGMLVGRLEIFTVLVLFTKSFWR